MYTKSTMTESIDGVWEVSLVLQDPTLGYATSTRMSHVLHTSYMNNGGCLFGCEMDYYHAP